MERQVAEKELVTCGGRSVVQRAFDFHPLERDTGRSLGSHERVPEVVGAGPVEAAGVGNQGFTRKEPDLADVVGGRVGSDVETADMTVEDPVAGVDIDGFVAAATGHVLEIGKVFLALLGGDPDRVAAEADSVAASDGSLETVPGVAETGDVVARDPRDCFLIPGGRVCRPHSHRCGLVVDVALGLEAKDGIGGTVASLLLVVDLADQVTLFAGVVARNRGGRLRFLDREDLADGVVGCTHVAGDVDVGDVECVGDFVKAECLAVLGKLAFDLEPRGVQEVAECVLVFVGVQATLGGPSLGQGRLALCGCEAVRDGGEERLLGGGVGTLVDGLGRHLAGFETVVDFHPLREVYGVRGVESE